MSSEIFPFELVLEDNDSHKELFVKTVEAVLEENLQCENSFGCKILDCHTHVGSKKHLPVFVESELLFHNSYYNKGFAFCTTQLLSKKVGGYNKIFLIGYETFGELYIYETVELLTKRLGKSVEYCIAETVGDKFRVRSSVESSYLDNETYFAFIVPINTTLTTHDKLLQRFSEWCKKKGVNVEYTKDNCINIALVVIAPTDNNDYWEVVSEKDRILHLKENKQNELVRLNDKDIHYFAWIKGEWYNSEKCKSCFPDLDNGSLKDEQALFEVNRASVVPMLQLGVELVEEPLILQNKDREVKNIAKLFILNQYLLHRHIVRNGNHYQYYFDTQRFFQHVRNVESDLGLKSWLEKEVKDAISLKISQENSDRIIYHFIVSPRHYSNAGFVQCVNDIVFGGSARILYLDVNKEYRGNVKAKYSDLTRLVDNIVNSRQPSKLCFHYVDDMIFSGGNYLRTKNLLNTLISSSKIDELWSKSLFESIIILVGRNSKDSKEWFIGNADKFYEYVHLSVSPMRNHEDACTLCKMVKSSEKLKEICATNEMANRVERTIKNHMPKEMIELEEKEGNVNRTTDEKKARVLIRHLLIERLSNHWWLKDGKKKPMVIDRESKEDIYLVIRSFYESLWTELNEKCYKSYFLNELKDINIYSENDLKIALIKVISRPFFCYHIRQKQAALKFCLETLDTILNKNVKDITENEGIVIRPLVNALADLNSVYLIRAEVMSKIILILRDKDKKKYLSDIEYCAAIKKVVGMSSDDSKSLLLEHILKSGNEKMFFSQQFRTMGGFLTECPEEIRHALYLENNSVLVEGFRDIISNKLECQSVSDIPYYLEKFYKIIKLNVQNEEKELSKLIESYKTMYNQLKIDKPNRECLRTIANEVRNLFDEAQAKMFFRSKSEEIVYDGYYLLNDEKDVIFYSRDNLRKIECILNSNPILDTVYVGEQLCVVKIAEEGAGEIYFSYVNTESEQNENWFKVKVVLTLRNEFVQMMKRLNVVNEMNKLDIERKEKALKIRKAHSHYSYEYFEGMKEFELRSTPEKKNENFVDEMMSRKRLFDNYWLMLSNDFVSDLYRKGIYYSQEIPYKGVRLGKRLSECLEAAGFEQNGEYLSYEIVTPNKKSEEDITVKIKCKVDDFQHKKFWCFGRGEKLVPYYYYLILSFAANAGFHYLGEKDSICELQVTAEGDYIVFRNAISNEEISEAALESMRMAAQKKLDIPPWEFECSDQSITLWAFFRYFEILDKRYMNLLENERGRKMPTNSTNGNGICISVDDNSFIVKLKMLEHVERRSI